MLVFIDESGYPGFKFTLGSDPVFALGMVIFADGTDDAGTLHSARVRIDGLGSRHFQRNLSSDLRRNLGQRVRDVKMSDSARDPLLQLADMCIGAIARAERDREDADRWKRMLAPRIAQISYFSSR